MMTCSATFQYQGVLPKEAVPQVARRILRSWGQYMLRETRANFREQHDPDGNPWVRHADVTSNKLFQDLWDKAQKRNLKTTSKTYGKLEAASKKILYRTGDLFRSIVAAYTDASVILGSSLPYAWVHQFGAKFKTTAKQSVWMWANLFGRIGNPFRFHTLTIPQRQFVGFTLQNERVCVLLAEQHALVWLRSAA